MVQFCTCISVTPCIKLYYFTELLMVVTSTSMSCSCMLERVAMSGSYRAVNACILIIYDHG